MRGRRILYVIIPGAVGLVAALWVLWPWERQGTVAVPASQIPCVAPEMVPAFQPPLAASDCVTSIARLPNGDIVLGTRDGLGGIVHDGKLESRRPPKAAGPITDIAVISGVGGEHSAVLFVVDQGIGAFGVETRSFAPFSPAETQKGLSMLVNGYINPPGPGRPVLTSDGYVKNKDDGTEQALSFFVASSGSVCGTYATLPIPPGAIQPSVHHPWWCTAAGSVYYYTPASPAPRPSGGCSVTATAVADPSHRLTEVVTAEGFQTKTFTINAGETYSLTLDNQDIGVVHMWAVLDAKTPDGLSVCIAPIAGLGQSSISFTIAQPGRYTIRDSIHPNIQGELVVR